MQKPPSRFKLLSIMLFFAVLLASLTPVMTQIPTFEREEYKDVQQKLILDLSNTEFNFDMPEGAYKIEIQYLETNNSKIEIRAFNQSRTFFHMTNVTKISENPVIVEYQSDIWYESYRWNVTISRLTTNASLSVQARVYYLMQILIDYAPIPNLGIFGFIIGGISLHFFIVADKSWKKKAVSSARKPERPLLVAILIIIAGLLSAPLAIFTYQGQNIVNTQEMSQERVLDITLNSTHPSLSLCIEDISDTEVTNKYTRITATSIQNAFFIIQLGNIGDMYRYQILSYNLSQKQNWGFHVTDLTNFSNITIERVNQDINVSLSWKIYYTTSRIEPQPVFAIILVCIGGIPFLYGLMIAHELEKKLQKTAHN
ncbi:MAG: membrane protein of unknown function [Candidatus Thorarchaeota archaeon]|nr:MAG: membrane protein of unknown function [Candidatus Thorarchaeota archaeon]